MRIWITYVLRLWIWSLILFIFCKMSFISLQQFLLPRDMCASVWRPVLSEQPKRGKGMFIRNRPWVGIHIGVHLCGLQTWHTKTFCLQVVIQLAAGPWHHCLLDTVNSNVHILCAWDMTMYAMCNLWGISLLQWSSVKHIKVFALVQLPSTYKFTLSLTTTTL